MNLKRLFAAGLVAAVFIPVLSLSGQPKKPPFVLTILHTNDNHAHQTPQADGDGGDARQAAVIKQARAKAKNVLLLDAGDRFTGTLLHQRGGVNNIAIMNALGFQAMALGNHEFDDGDRLLANFIDKVHFPLLSANIDASASPSLKGKIKPSTVLTVNGQRIGIIGLTTADTATNSSPGKELKFSKDYAAKVQAEADALDRTGVNKIIVLSHIGYHEDLDLAAKVSKVDAIVGGHSHTLFSNFYKEAPQPYPLKRNGLDGRPVYVVQAGGGDNRFIGRLELEFDEAGRVAKASGDTIHLSAYVTPDPDIAREVARLTDRVEQMMKQPILTPNGKPAVAVTELTVKGARVQELPLGDLIADAIRERAKSQMAVIGSGGLRNGLPAGPLTRGILANCLPFDNTVYVVSLKGKFVLQALENGVSRYPDKSGSGRFLQVSGLRFEFDPARPVGSRILRVEVANAKGGYDRLDPETVYTLGCDSFLFGGGDDFGTIAQRAIRSENLGYPVRDSVEKYIAEHSPIDPKVEGRIRRK